MTSHPPVPILPPSLSSTVTEVLYHSSPATFVVSASSINLPTPPPSLSKQSTPTSTSRLSTGRSVSSYPDLSSSSSSFPLISSLYYVNEDTGTFGLITLSHTSPPESRLTDTPLCTNLVRPTRVVLSGDVALKALYDNPPPTSLLPSTDEASKVLTESLQREYDRLLKRARPLAYILDAGAPPSAGDTTSTKGSIRAYNPETGEVKLLAAGLNNPAGLTCTPASDLVYIEDVTVSKVGPDGVKREYKARAVKCIAGRDVMDYAARGELVPRSRQVCIRVVNPSISRNARVPMLADDGTLLLAVERGNLAEMNRESRIGERHGSDDAGGSVLAYRPTRISPREDGGDLGGDPEYTLQPTNRSTASTLPLFSAPTSPPCPYFSTRGLGVEGRLYETFRYSSSPEVLYSNTAIIRDLCINPNTGGMIVAGKGRGPMDYRPHGIMGMEDGEVTPLVVGHAECVTVGGGGGFECLKSRPDVFGSSSEFGSTVGGASLYCQDDFAAFYVTKDIKTTKLMAVYSKESQPARAMRTRVIAKIPIPETPRPIEDDTIGREEEEEEEEESEVEEEQEELFNALSEGLAGEKGEGEQAKWMAQNDPTLKTSGVVNVKVILRCRPLMRREVKAMIPAGVRCTRNDVTVDGAFLPLKQDKTYAFDRVFGPDTSQRQLYQEAVAPIVQRVLDGFKCTVFAYGQTGSGKTYSMEGEAGGKKGSEVAGLIPRAVHSIFDELNKDKGCRYTVTASHMEVYLEQAYDLLASAGPGKWKSGGHMKEKLNIVERRGAGIEIDEDDSDYTDKALSLRGGGVEIVGLSEVVVKKPSDIFKIMHRTKQNRHAAETLCNRQSSRSHAIFTIKVTATRRIPGGKGGLMTKRGALNLVDLSGSESIKRSGAEGVQAREASMIGRSLLSLGRVIRSLVAKERHVPYRESKLTRILSDSLGGSSYTALLLAITPNSEMISETMSTLGYGMLARNIVNLPKKDEVIVKKKKKRINADGVEVEVSSDEDFELPEGFDGNGELRNLEKAAEEIREHVLPWQGSVPIRRRGAGEGSRGERVPLGDANRTPRVFHGETVEWSKGICDGGRLSSHAAKCFTDIFNKFDSNGDGEINMAEVKALDFTVGTDAGTPGADDYLAAWERTRKKKSRNPYEGNSQPGHITLERWLEFCRRVAVEDPLAARGMISKGGFTLSFGKAFDGGEFGFANATETSRKVQEEMEKEKEERNKKKFAASQLGGSQMAAKSKIAYESLEKIKEVASKKEGFDLKLAFKEFDLDGNGTVDHDELKAVVEGMCSEPDENGKIHRVAKWEMDAIIALFDPNNDGEIDYGEFAWTFFNRRALTSKDAGEEGGEGGGGGETGRTGATTTGFTATTGGGRRRKKKRDPDPVMPPPPSTAGFIKLSDAIQSLVELTPRDARGVRLRDLVTTKLKEKEKEKGKEKEGGRKALSVLQLRDVVESARSKGSGPKSTMARSKSAGTVGGGTMGAGGAGGGFAKTGGGKKNGRGEKPKDWQQWVIKSRNTWNKTAQKVMTGAKVDLRGGGGRGVANRSHPKVPNLW
ncbi:hypothetical protein TrCOL_g10369 [Triparma columacea]|uniref:Calmodulin n=1 Tax=Triparma columacea TaxID=722753 RepID=A0A9W7FZL3_9STRA|nr:hypothetical protein TrCOL_g10369 [Triparma columacea]